ncbi:MAG: hypothetical protein R2827_03870 [Bdellovibrionales bacterium]
MVEEGGDEFADSGDEWSEEGGDEFAENTDEFAEEGQAEEGGDDMLADLGEESAAEPIVEPEAVDVAEPAPVLDDFGATEPVASFDAGGGFEDPNASMGLVPVKKCKQARIEFVAAT